MHPISFKNASQKTSDLLSPIRSNEDPGKESSKCIPVIEEGKNETAEQFSASINLNAQSTQPAHPHSTSQHSIRDLAFAPDGLLALSMRDRLLARKQVP